MSATKKPPQLTVLPEPETLQEFRQAIANEQEHMTNGDCYDAVVQAMREAGWKEVQPVEFKDPNLWGMRFRKAGSKGSPATVCRGDLLGVFTDLQFNSKLGGDA
jgi:hypothetical protein